LLPLAVMAAIGGGALVPTLGGAAPPPTLPSETPQQLLADMVQAKPPALSGAISWTSNLGLSDLSTVEDELGQSGDSSSASVAGIDPLSFLSGSYQFDVWLGSQAEHIAFSPSDAEEADLVRNGNQVWSWDSTTSTVTHFIFEAPGGAAQAAAASSSDAATLTPQQLADRLLQHLGPTTSVTTGTPLYVAGQPAYQLIFAPKAATGTTVDHIEVDLGSNGSLLGAPLAVAVYSLGQSAPAIELAFTGSLNLGEPPASELTFAPPPGAQVVTHVEPGRGVGAGAGATTAPGSAGNLGLGKTGSGWLTVISGQDQELANTVSNPELSGLTSVVTVGGQPARLLSTDLLNVLIMPDGHFYAGLVTPSAL